MTAFNEYDVVRLTSPLPEHGLDAGARGAILMVFEEQQPTEYEVEFLNPDGETIALLTLPVDFLRRDD
jgi:hypothetical protein